MYIASSFRDCYRLFHLDAVLECNKVKTKEVTSPDFAPAAKLSLNLETKNAQSDDSALTLLLSQSVETHYTDIECEMVQGS